MSFEFLRKCVLFKNAALEMRRVLSIVVPLQMLFFFFYVAVRTIFLKHKIGHTISPSWKPYSGSPLPLY